MIKYRKFAKFLRQLDVNEGIFILTWNSGGNNIHGPNEKIHIPTWKRGVDALIHFFYNLADLQDQ